MANLAQNRSTRSNRTNEPTRKVQTNRQRHARRVQRRKDVWKYVNKSLQHYSAALSSNQHKPLIEIHFHPVESKLYCLADRNDVDIDDLVQTHVSAKSRYIDSRSGTWVVQYGAVQNLARGLFHRRTACIVCPDCKVYGLCKEVENLKSSW